MTWQPGQPVVTADDVADWQTWRKARKLEQQRYYRAHARRIDYYPSTEAEAVIDRYTGHTAGHDYASVINALILHAAEALPDDDDGTDER